MKTRFSVIYFPDIKQETLGLPIVFVLAVSCQQADSRIALRIRHLLYEC